MKGNEIQMSTTSPYVSILILNYNAVEITLRCIKAIKRYTFGTPYEIIVIDNGSRPVLQKKLWHELRELDALITRIGYQQNLGFAKAYNRAVKKTKGNICIFLNNDTVVSAGWLKPLVRTLGKNARIAVCQPKLRSLMTKDDFDYAGGCGGFLDILGYPFTRGRIFNHVEKDIGQYDSVTDVAWASGACFAVSKPAFEEVGGFDEYFFVYGEEVDLCIRLQFADYRIISVPQSLVYHQGAYTSNQNEAAKIFFIHLNHLYLFCKYYSLIPYFPLYVVRFIFDLLSLVYYLTEGKPRFVFAVVRAYFVFAQDLPHFIKTRIISLRGRSLMRLPTVFPRSVVIDYFILGKTSFQALIQKSYYPYN